MAKLDILKHILVPKHIKLSEKDKGELLNRYHLTLKELPKIDIKDPAIADMDVKEGEVIKIIRQSPTAGECAFYRRVSHG